MGFTLTKVQDYRKVPGKNEVRLVGENPYIRFSHREHTGVFLQSGNFYDEGGNVIEVEQWMVDAVSLVDIDKLRRVGLNVEEFAQKHNVELGTKKVKPSTVAEDEDEEQEAVRKSDTTRRRR